MSRSDEEEVGGALAADAAAGPGTTDSAGPDEAAPASGKDDRMLPREVNPRPIGVGFRMGAAGSAAEGGEEEEAAGTAPAGADLGTNSFARTDSSTAPFENCSRGDISPPDWSTPRDADDDPAVGGGKSAALMTGDTVRALEEEPPLPPEPACGCE
jgi:hypothetical protein